MCWSWRVLRVSGAFEANVRLIHGSAPTSKTNPPFGGAQATPTQMYIRHYDIKVQKQTQIQKKMLFVLNFWDRFVDRS